MDYKNEHLLGSALKHQDKDASLLKHEMLKHEKALMVWSLQSHRNGIVARFPVKTLDGADLLDMAL